MIKMNSLIQVVNRLQDVFRSIDTNVVQLPQIAVVGTQSAGKSSVIESIAGYSFLPRGTGIVTRRPLVLQLLRCPLDDTKYRSKEKGTLSLNFWAEFLHKDQIFTDLDAIRKEIEIDTDRVAGDNKGINEEAINLKVYCKDVVDLTLVDLPGLTKVPVGDQPQEIETQIRNLIFKYIENDNCIILAVTSANVDISTSEALKFAKEVDPDGSRTLAVLTKIDLMDEGTNATDVLNGTVLPVKLGIVGVINRSQKDINQNKKIQEQLDKEAEFFKKNYPDFAEHSGTPYLSIKLSNLLIDHIRLHLPDLQKRVRSMISKNQELLKSYGDGVIDKEHTLFTIITKFAKVFRKSLVGTIRNSEPANNTALYRILHEDFESTLNTLQPTVDVKLARESLLESSAGPRPHLFDVPSFDIPFENLVKSHIVKVLEPSLDLIQRVHKEIRRNVQNCETEMKIEWNRFPKLKRKIFDFLIKMVSGREDVAKDMVRNLIDSEMAYINKKHPDFCKEKAITPLVNYVPTNTIYATVNVQALAGTLLSGAKGEKVNCEVLQNLVKLYFDVVRKTVADAVPKAIMFSIVNFMVENVESELLKNIYKTDDLPMLMGESNDISTKREHARSMLTALTRASEIIDEVYEGGDYE